MGKDDISLYMALRPESLALLMFGLSLKREAGSEKKLKARTSVFDIGVDWGDSPIVLTPFQTMLESVPRPIIRSMSTSWVVEVAEGPSIHHEQSSSSGGRCKVRTKEW
jgi:hypothetical protein